MASFSLLLLICLSSLFFFFFNNNLAAKHTNASTNDHHNPNNPNPRLRRAYTALQAWKRAIHSDPKNFTANWRGPDVCGYTGVYCAPAPDDNRTRTVAGVDLNRGDIAGFLPEELGLLSDLTLLHLNSNRFCGVVPHALSNLTLLFELDLSNNRLVGPFPGPVLSLQALKYLDLRFNEFEGTVPPQLFSLGLDAVFLNNNRFTGIAFPPAGPAPGASVLVLANNDYSGGRLPEGIGRLAGTLEELLAANANLSGCLPEGLGQLYKLRLLDVSSNALVGPLPYAMAGLYHLELLNVAHNRLSGAVLPGLCRLPRLSNFTVSYNFFCEEDDMDACAALRSKKGVLFDDRRNCLPDRPLQRPQKVCEAALRHPPSCY